VAPGNNSFKDTVSRNSFYVYSSFNLNHADNGIITDDGTSSPSHAQPSETEEMPLSLPEGVKLGYVDSDHLSMLGLHFNKVHLIHRATIRSISIYMNSASSEKMIMGLYRSEDEKPSRLIAGTKEFAPAQGWNTLEVTSQVVCEPGDYWVGWLPSSRSLNVRQRMREPRYFEGYAADVNYTYGPLPDRISGRVSYSNAVSSIYAYFIYDHSAKKSPE